MTKFHWHGASHSRGGSRIFDRGVKFTKGGGGGGGFDLLILIYYSKTCVMWPLSKRPKIGFQDQLLLNAGQKYCRMLQGEHSTKL